MTEDKFNKKFKERIIEYLASFENWNFDDGFKIINAFQTFYELGLLDAKKPKKRKK